MVAIKLAVSITEEQQKYIIEKNLSASGLLQTAIEQHKERDRDFSTERKHLTELWIEKKKQLEGIEEFIERSGLWEQYQKLKEVKING